MARSRVPILADDQCRQRAFNRTLEAQEQLSTFDGLCFLVLPRGGAQPHNNSLNRGVRETLHASGTAARRSLRLGAQDAYNLQ